MKMKEKKQELNEQILEQVSGGSDSGGSDWAQSFGENMRCESCKEDQCVSVTRIDYKDGGAYAILNLHCNNCGYEWTLGAGKK